MEDGRWNSSRARPLTLRLFESIGVLKAWLADDDLQEITVCSTNIGFVKTFTKSFRREGA